MEAVLVAVSAVAQARIRMHPLALLAQVPAVAWCQVPPACRYPGSGLPFCVRGLGGWC
jgi:hypothetical protein